MPMAACCLALTICERAMDKLHVAPRASRHPERRSAKNFFQSINSKSGLYKGNNRNVTAEPSTSDVISISLNIAW